MSSTTALVAHHDQDGFVDVPTPDGCIVYVESDLLKGGPNEDGEDVQPSSPLASPRDDVPVTAITAGAGAAHFIYQHITIPNPSTLPDRPVKPVRAIEWVGHDGIADFDVTTAKASGSIIDQIQAVQRTRYRIKAIIQVLRSDIESQTQVRHIYF